MSEVEHERTGPDFEAISVRASGLKGQVENLVQRADSGDVTGIRTAIHSLREGANEIEALLADATRAER